MVIVFKQKTAYEMRISDWSSDVCTSELQRYRAVEGWRARIRYTDPYRGLPAGAAGRKHLVDRRRRRIGGLGGLARRPEGRPAERGRRSGAGLLWPRRNGADRKSVV